MSPFAARDCAAAMAALELRSADCRIEIFEDSVLETLVRASSSEVRVCWAVDRAEC